MAFPWTGVSSTPQVTIARPRWRRPARALGGSGCYPATGAVCLWNPAAVPPTLRRVGEQLTQAEIVFVVFGVATQALLLGFFAARRWSPQLADRFGWVVYAFSGLGLPLGVWLLLDGQSWRLFVGPLLMAAWAVFGATVDLWRPRQWRRTPVLWNVLIPYLVLYFSAQMFLWWPLWNIERAAWAVFLLLFVPSTVLNIRGHFGDGASG